MNLVDEGIPAGDVLITGSTAVDAALAAARRRPPYRNATVAAARAASHGRRLILVTTRHRESWGVPLDRILEAVRALVRRYPDVEVVLPSPRDPAVRTQVTAGLAGLERVTVTGPLPYPDLSRLLNEAYLVLTDTGGLQEEAPSFGVPVLVLRDVTERVELLHAGCARLVGSDTDLIVKEAAALLDDPASPRRDDRGRKSLRGRPRRRPRRPGHRRPARPGRAAGAPAGRLGVHSRVGRARLTIR
jgi:UDP-N-acetylglucosamine 2-epimerase (non-hydrolysing)